MRESKLWTFFERGGCWASLPIVAASNPEYQLVRSLSGPDQPPPDPMVLLVTSTSFRIAFASLWVLLALGLYRRVRTRPGSSPLAWLLLGLLTGPLAWIIFALRCRGPASP